jgi:hypothetical protein
MMEMKALMGAAENFLQENMVPKDVFDVLDSWVFLEKTEKIDRCIQVNHSRLMISQTE